MEKQLKKKIQKDKKQEQKKEEPKEPKEEKELTPEEEMQALFGFSNFQSTKDKPHEETNIEGVRKNKKLKRKFRQYMNRRGGFNKPLESI